MGMVKFNPLALSLSKGASGLEAWFDKFTTNDISANGFSTSLETNGVV